MNLNNHKKLFLRQAGKIYMDRVLMLRNDCELFVWKWYLLQHYVFFLKFLYLEIEVFMGR